VFSVPNGQKLYQFRRGTYPARIYSISFNLANTLLAVSSDTDTIHVFKLETTPESSPVPVVKKASMIETITNPIATAAGAVGNFLPDMLTDMFEPTRDFAHAKLPSSSKGIPNICALTSAHLIVVTADCYFYQYPLDSKGGECGLVKQYALKESEEEGNAPA
jgi:autophagy-related protein 18